MPQRVGHNLTNTERPFNRQSSPPPIATLSSTHSPAESSSSSFEPLSTSTSASSPIMYASALPSIRPHQYNYPVYRGSDHEREGSYHHGSSGASNGTYTPTPSNETFSTNNNPSSWNNGHEYHGEAYTANTYGPYASSKYAGTVGAVPYGSASAAYHSTQNSGPYTTSSAPNHHSNSSAQSSPQHTIIHTDDAATKLSVNVRRRCFNCCTSDTSTWRRSNLNPGKVLCNKCGLFERTHSRSRPDQFPHRRGPLAAAMVKRNSPSLNGNSGQSPRMRDQLQNDSGQAQNYQTNHGVNGSPQTTYVTPNHRTPTANAVQQPSNTDQKNHLPPISSYKTDPDNRSRSGSQNSTASQTPLPEIQSWLRDGSNGSDTRPPFEASTKSPPLPPSVPSLPRVVGMDKRS